MVMESHMWQFGLPGLIELLVVGMMLCVVAVFVVLPFWFIFKKAGFPGALSLLMLVPVVHLVMLFFLAFADWPALAPAAHRGPPLGQ
jgi:hypothetical protein